MEYSKSYYRRRFQRLRKRDEVFANKFLDLANLGGAALAFGQFINPHSFRSFVFIIGILIVIVAYMYMWYYLSRFN